MKTKVSVEKSESERRAVAALRSAEEKRRYEDLVTVGVYATHSAKTNFYGVPFYAKSDALAASALRSSLELEHDPGLAGVDLYCIGKYRFDTAKFSGVKPRFIAY